MFVVRAVGDLEIVHVYPDDDGLLPRAVRRVHGASKDEDALVRLALREAELDQPREEGSLPPTAGLSHTVDGLADHAHDGDRAEVRRECAHEPTARGSAVDHLIELELTLEVSCDEVPPPEVVAACGCEACDYAQRR